MAWWGICFAAELGEEAVTRMGCWSCFENFPERKESKELGKFIRIAVGGVETKWVQVIAHDRFPRVAEKVLLRSFRLSGPGAMVCVGALGRM